MTGKERRDRRLDLTRRSLLRVAGAAAGLIAAPALVGCVGGPSWRNGDPFSLGVAAGEPTPDGFVLWTRLAPEPLAPDPATPAGIHGGPLALTDRIPHDPARCH